MKKDTAFREYLLHDVFGDFPDVEIRAMMGGNLIRKSGLAVGILDDGAVFFKTGEENMADFDRYGAKWFTYFRNGKEVTMNYREVTTDILEDREEIRGWLAKAYDIALNSRRKWKKR